MIMTLILPYRFFRRADEIRFQLYCLRNHTFINVYLLYRLVLFLPTGGRMVDPSIETWPTLPSLQIQFNVCDSLENREIVLKSGLWFPKQYSCFEI